LQCEEIFAAGFFIERLLEPRPMPEAAAIDPEKYGRLAREPMPEAAAIDPEKYGRLAREPRGSMAFRLRPRP